MPYFLSRSQAARAAMRAGITNFWTHDKPDHQHARVWEYSQSIHNAPAGLTEFAEGKDYVHHTETRYIEGGRHPGVCGVLIITCLKEELPKEDIQTAEAAGFTFEPITPSLWSTDKGGTTVNAKERKATGQRARSEVESPTKVVWRIADEMKGATRAEIVEACVAAGVNKATASTQFYRWQKAQNG